MVVIRKMMSAAILTTCAFFIFGLFTRDGGSTSSEPSSLVDQFIGWMIASWIIGTFVYGTLLRSGNPRRGWAFSLLVLWTIFVVMVAQQQSTGDVFVHDYFYRAAAMLFFGVPVMQFLDLVLPPYLQRVSTRKRLPTIAGSV